MWEPVSYFFLVHFCSFGRPSKVKKMHFLYAIFSHSLLYTWLSMVSLERWSNVLVGHIGSWYVSMSSTPRYEPLKFLGKSTKSMNCWSICCVLKASKNFKKCMPLLPQVLAFKLYHTCMGRDDVSVLLWCECATYFRNSKNPVCTKICLENSEIKLVVSN